MAKNRSLRGVNEDFEPFFNAVFTSAVIRAKVSVGLYPEQTRNKVGKNET